MKKLVIAIVFVLCFMCGSVVLADAAVMYEGFYDTVMVVVKNVNGAEYYDENNQFLGTIPYGKKIMVFNRSELDDGYLWFYDFYGAEPYYANRKILSTDVEIYGEPVTPEDVFGTKEIESIGEKYVCLDNCYMYISPGRHNKLAMEEPIPIGTVLECKGLLYNAFTYTTYNGVSGWIWLEMQNDNMNSEVASKYKVEIIATKDVSLLDKPLYDASIIDSISKNTKLNTKWIYGYEVEGEMRGYYMVSYNNQLGWIDTGNCAVKGSGSYSQTHKFTEDLIIDGEIVIPSGEIVKLNSEYTRIICIFDGDGIIPMTDYYFSYNGYDFWFSDVYELSNLVENSTNDLIEVGNGSTEVEEQIKQSGEISASEEDSGEEVINIFDIQNQKKEQSNINMAILCICGAVVLALTSIVILILANKKLAEVNKKNVISEDDVDWKETK